MGSVDWFIVLAGGKSTRMGRAKPAIRSATARRSHAHRPDAFSTCDDDVVVVGS